MRHQHQNPQDLIQYIQSFDNLEQKLDELCQLDSNHPHKQSKRQDKVNTKSTADAYFSNMESL